MLDTKYRVNNETVSIEEMAEAWLEKQEIYRITTSESPVEIEVVLPEPASEFSYQAKIEKLHDEQQIAFGVVLRPNVTDTQGDFYTLEEVEKAAHFYMAKSMGAADLLHEVEVPRDAAVMVESFIAPTDFLWGKFKVLKGDWIGGMWVPNEEIWKVIKLGKINAFSITGRGLREILAEATEV